MISYEKLTQVSDALETFRAQKSILFDSRDRGNYSGYEWNKTVAMLRKSDPTNLAIGMLLNEMLEATINGSKVNLSDVLRQEGFIDSLHVILDVKKVLDAEIAEPMAGLIGRLEASLKKVSPELGMPTTREVAICLRDAIYCIDKGLQLRWLECRTSTVGGQMPLNSSIAQYPDISSFIEALRTSLPFGAHLARIGQSQTAIGFKQLGRVAYLSSLSINVHQGTMDESRASSYLMTDSLDLDTAIERYPNWVTHQPGRYGQLVAAGQDTHQLDHISKLPRDRVIWLAMVVEMTSQRMATKKQGRVELSESVSLALPGFAKESTNLPVVIQPNWTLEGFSLETEFKELGFSAWKEAFLMPALDGLTADVFLPVDSDIAITPSTGKFEIIPKAQDIRYNISSDHNAIRMTGMASDWVGSKKEIEAARQHMFRKNLSLWLYEWGAYHFKVKCGGIKYWFGQKLRANMPQALSASCVKWESSGFNCRSGHHLYSQSLKHKMYNPRCYFNVRSEVTDVAHFVPKNSADLVEMLGLAKESDLPDFLRGWRRGELHAETHVNSRRCDGQYLEASACVNKANLPAECAVGS